MTQRSPLFRTHLQRSDGDRSTLIHAATESEVLYHKHIRFLGSGDIPMVPPFAGQSTPSD